MFFFFFCLLLHDTRIIHRVIDLLEYLKQQKNSQSVQHCLYSVCIPHGVSICMNEATACSAYSVDDQKNVMPAEVVL